MGAGGEVRGVPSVGRDRPRRETGWEVERERRREGVGARGLLPAVCHESTEGHHTAYKRQLGACSAEECKRMPALDAFVFGAR